MTDLETIELNGLSFDVIAREPAMLVSSLTHGKQVVATTVDKLLLNTGDEVFQCVHPNRGDCRYVADNSRSVVAHQRAHGDRLIAKKVNAKLAEVEKKQAAEFKRRSVGMRAANEAKKQRHATEVTSTDPRVAKIQRDLSDLAVGVEKVKAMLTPLAEAMRELNTQLGEITLQKLQEAEVDVDKMSTEEKFRLMKKLMS